MHNFFFKLSQEEDKKTIFLTLGDNRIRQVFHQTSVDSKTGKEKESQIPVKEVIKSEQLFSGFLQISSKSLTAASLFNLKRNVTMSKFSFMHTRGTQQETLEYKEQRQRTKNIKTKALFPRKDKHKDREQRI